MPSPTCTCFVLDRETKRMVYEADSIPQAVGYSDRRKRPSIIALSASTFGSQTAYRLAMIDANGQVIARGPVVHVFDAIESLCETRIVILPCNADEEAQVFA